MGAGDNSLRSGAIPYYANVWGYNRSTDSDLKIANSTATLGDLTNFASGGTLSTINAIRVLQPHFGRINNASLNLKFTLATAEPARQLRIAIGDYSSRYTPRATYTDAEINASHLLITKQVAPFSISAAGTFNNAKLDLTDALYDRNNVKFLEDAFVLLLVFDSAPSTGAGWSFDKLEIDCTMQMGLN